MKFEFSGYVIIPDFKVNILSIICIWDAHEKYSVISNLELLNGF